jgi:hypothetical protein
MPTASETTSETAGRATTAGDDNIDALEGVYHSLRSGEAKGEEAIASTIHALTELVRAAMPVAVNQPSYWKRPLYERR